MLEKELYWIIGQNVRYCRQLYNLGKASSERITQEKLAERVCQGVSVYVLWNISRVLNVPIDRLFESRD